MLFQNQLDRKWKTRLLYHRRFYAFIVLSLHSKLVIKGHSISRWFLKTGESSLNSNNHVKTEQKRKISWTRKSRILTLFIQYVFRSITLFLAYHWLIIETNQNYTTFAEFLYSLYVTPRGKEISRSLLDQDGPWISLVLRKTNFVIIRFGLISIFLWYQY